MRISEADVSELERIFGTRSGYKAHGAVTVGTSAVLFRAAYEGRRSLIIQNLGPGDLYIGNSAIAVGNSPKLKPDGVLTIDRCDDDIYAVASAAGTDVRFLEERAQ